MDDKAAEALGQTLGHMAGNLKLYQGAEAINKYAEFLKDFGKPVLPREGLLWIARVSLLAFANEVGIVRHCHHAAADLCGDREVTHGDHPVSIGRRFAFFESEADLDGKIRWWLRWLHFAEIRRLGTTGKEKECG